MRIFLVLLGAAALFVGAICDQSDDTAVPCDLSIDTVYDRVEESLMREGQVAVIRKEPSDLVWADGVPTPLVPTPMASPVIPSGYHETDYGHTTWIDATDALFKSESRYLLWTVPPVEQLSSRLIRDGQVYDVELNGRSDSFPVETCYETNARATIALLGCPNADQETETVIEKGTWEGQEAVILFTRGVEILSEGVRARFEERIYISAETWLPAAEVYTRLATNYEGLAYTSTATYRIIFVSRNSLGEDFFDLASIGYEPNS